MTVASTTARALYQRLETGGRPPILDVRNREEFGRWRIETRGPLDLLNVPYFEFIELEDESVRKVTAWLAGRTEPLVAVCAKGDSSAFVAERLRGRGIAAINLQEGMAGWGLETAVRPIPVPGPVRAWQILRFGRGCLAYVVAVGEDAIVVDPHRAIDDYRALLDAQRLRLRGVFETHLHADHVSGARALAQTAGVPYQANRADFDGATFPVEPVEDGGRLRFGGVEVAAVVTLHTPGHTPGSTSLLVNDALLLTGDTVFVSGVGRPDLGGQTAAWARALYRTLHDRLARVAPGVLVLPAHSSGPQELGADGTVAGRLGAALEASAALAADEADFVRAAEAQAGGAPAQYARIRMINLGRAAATAEELVELELGKNECALARH